MLRTKSAVWYWQSIVAKSRDSGLLIKNARGTSGQVCSMYCAHSSEWGLFGRNTRSAIRGTSSSPPREERADIGKDDVVEARKWIPNTPYIINTRARRCACIFIRLAAIKASNCIIVSLDSRRRFILVDLSAKVRTPPL